MVTDEEFLKLCGHVESLMTRMLKAERDAYFLRAWVDSLEGFCVQTSDWTTEAERQDIVSRLRGLQRHVYDDYMKELEDRDPRFAAMMDVRPFLSESEQERWYVPEPPTDLLPSA